jgi:hypothetical protein
MSIDVCDVFPLGGVLQIVNSVVLFVAVSVTHNGSTGLWSKKMRRNEPLNFDGVRLRIPHQCGVRIAVLIVLIRSLAKFAALDAVHVAGATNVVATESVNRNNFQRPYAGHPVPRW